MWRDTMLCKICGSDSVLLVKSDSYVEAQYNYDFLVCRGCGVGFVEPMPTDNQIKLFYPTSYFSPLGSYNLGWSRKVKAFIGKCRYSSTNTVSTCDLLCKSFARLVELLAGKQTPCTFGLPLASAKTTEILDVGCGSGGYLALLSANGFTNLTGLDISSHQKVFLESLGVNYICGDIFSDKLTEAGYDLIRLENVFEHLKDPVEVLKRLQVLLKPDGRILINVPSLTSFAYKNLKLSYTGLQLPKHLYHYTPSSLSFLCQHVGLELVEIKNITNWDDYLTSLAEYVSNKEKGFKSRLLKSSLLNALSPVYNILNIIGNRGEYISVILGRPHHNKQNINL